MRNRFGHDITRGLHVIVTHPRGGTYRAEVARIYRAPAYGWHAAIAEVRKLGHTDPVYRNGRLISAGA